MRKIKLENLLKNPHLKIHINPAPEKEQSEKTLSVANKEKKKSVATVNFTDVCNAIKNANIKVAYDDKHISIILEGARVLSLNQMMTYLQRNRNGIPYYMAQYKSVWENKMKEVMETLFLETIKNKKQLPQFGKKKYVKLILYRESLKLLDEDSVAASFKYVIDGLRKTYNVLDKSFNLIPDDNQNYINNIETYQVSSKNHNIAIKMIFMKKTPKIVNNLNDFEKIF